MFDVLRNSIFALLPVYREKKEELEECLTSFRNIKINTGLQLVIIVDGVEDTLANLFPFLEIKTVRWNKTECFDWISGLLPISDLTFVLIKKYQHGGKRDSIALFLQLLYSSCCKALPDFNSPTERQSGLENFLLHHKTSILMIDGDTNFNPNAIQHLFEQLWLPKHKNVYTVTPTLQCKTAGIKDIYGHAQNANYEIYNYFFCATELNGEVVVTKDLLFGLQACGLFKANYLMDEKVIKDFSRDPRDFYETLIFSMNEDTYLTSLIKEKKPQACFVPAAKICTSLPDNLTSFLSQKRRWRNGNKIQQLKLRKEESKNQTLIKRTLGNTLQITKNFIKSPAAYFYVQFTIFLLAFNLTVNKNLVFITTFFLVMGIFIILRHTKISALFSLLSVSVLLGMSLIYLSGFLLTWEVVFGNFSWVFLLAIIIVFVNPLLTLILIQWKRTFSPKLVYGVLLKYLLLEPIYKFLLPIYANVHADELSWRTSCPKNSKIDIRPEIIKEGKNIWYKQLSIFIVENLFFCCFLMCMPTLTMLVIFAFIEGLYTFILIVSPLIESHEEVASS